MKQNHKGDKGMEENEMVCKDCGMKFNNQEELEQHNMNTGHGGDTQQPGQDMPEQMPPEQTPPQQMPGDEGGQQDEGMGEDDNPRGAM